METIRTRTRVVNGRIALAVPAHWNNKEVDVVLTADESSALPAGDAKIGNGAHLMAIAEAIVAKGGVISPPT